MRLVKIEDGQVVVWLNPDRVVAVMEGRWDEVAPAGLRGKVYTKVFVGGLEEDYFRLDMPAEEVVRLLTSELSRRGIDGVDR